jgi:hypothetical protein
MVKQLHAKIFRGSAIIVMGGVAAKLHGKLIDEDSHPVSFDPWKRIDAIAKDRRVVNQHGAAFHGVFRDNDIDVLSIAKSPVVVGDI